jgi:hypothetical protein
MNSERPANVIESQPRIGPARLAEGGRFDSVPQIRSA